METRAYYTERLTRQRPGLFVVLLDQSGSMSEQVEGEQLTKADYATAAVNELIATMCDAAGVDDSNQVKKLAYISVFGYNDSVMSVLNRPGGPPGEPLDIRYLSQHFVGTQEVQRAIFDSGANTYRTAIVTAPYWIDQPKAEGRTQMAKALQQAQFIIQRWLDTAMPLPPQEPGQAARHECFPPVVINITDAEHNGEGDPEAVAAAIRSQGTSQGNCLIFTCHITKDRRQPLVFPSSPAELVQLHPTAVTMFNMSSIMPDLLREKAARITHGRQVPPGAHTFVYNANAQLLAEFLRWGTQGTVGGW
ncbi:MAG: hypothetical protein OJF49_001306 [Ktedonobacterales bacterium]|jgi:hypothetical protein|nr:MAG: hypothetical protein OJF49_001306 [Ktedonobacterales bacterium]